MSTENTQSQQLIDEFVGAAHGDFDKVKRLIADHPHLISANASWHELAIEAASQTGRVDIVDFLLAAGARLDICTAVMLGDMEMTKKFLKTDSSLISARGAHGLPLMYYVAIRGNQEIARFLLEQGADINAGRGGNSALHGAVNFNQSEMVTWLLANGADANALDYNGKTPLQLAEENTQTEIAALLRQAQ
ncbi:MAG TPA: ankyrin repeat domain-containing protein [Anaerolineales bacterium]|nr:ankyrin repeat domain-containing protein [Anaerolineales bacterium]